MMKKKSGIVDELIAKETANEEGTTIETEEAKGASKVEKTRKEKKPMSNKKLATILIIFTLVAAVVTFGLIYMKNKEKENTIVETPKQEAKADESGFAIKSLTETYKNNSLTENEVKLHYGKMIKEDDYSYYQVQLNYPQITGLKDENVQAKINGAIREKVMSLYDEKVLSDKAIKSIDIYVYITANFADVISVDIAKHIYYSDEQKTYETENYGLNFKLDNGEKINFCDMFINTANIDNIMQKAIYEALVWDKYYDYAELNVSEDDDRNFVIDMSKIDYTDFESDMILAMKKYKAEGIKVFSFGESTIYAYIGDLQISIKMKDIYDKIAIYKRFISKESLYKDDTIGAKDIFVFSWKSNGEYSGNGHVSDNFYMEIDVNSYSEETFNNAMIEKIVNKAIKDIKLKAKKNPKKAYILTGDINISEKNEEVDTFEVSEQLYLTTMTKKYYDEKGLLEYANEIASYDNGERSSIPFTSNNNTKDRKTIEIENKYYVDLDCKVLDFWDVSRLDNVVHKKGKYVSKYKMPVITKDGPNYMFSYSEDSILNFSVQEGGMNLVDTEEVVSKGKTNEWRENIFANTKVRVANIIKEIAGIDVSKTLKNLKLIRGEENAYGPTYYGGNTIVSYDDYYVHDEIYGIIYYLMSITNKTEDSLFANAKGYEQNRWLKNILANKIANYCCGYVKSYAEQEKMKDTNLLLDIYGKELLIDAFTGRTSIVEKNLKDACSNNLEYDGIIAACDVNATTDSTINEYNNRIPFTIVLDKVLNKKGVSYILLDN